MAPKGSPIKPPVTWTRPTNRRRLSEMAKLRRGLTLCLAPLVLLQQGAISGHSHGDSPGHGPGNSSGHSAVPHIHVGHVLDVLHWLSGTDDSDDDSDDPDDDHDADAVYFSVAISHGASLPNGSAASQDWSPVGYTIAHFVGPMFVPSIPLPFSKPPPSVHNNCPLFLSLLTIRC